MLNRHPIQDNRGATNPGSILPLAFYSSNSGSNTDTGMTLSICLSQSWILISFYLSPHG